MEPQIVNELEEASIIQVQTPSSMLTNLELINILLQIIIILENECARQYQERNQIFQDNPFLCVNQTDSCLDVCV